MRQTEELIDGSREAIASSKELLAQSAHPLPPEGGDAMTKFHHILVVDDDRDVSDVVGGLLENMGYRATSCFSAAEARDVLARQDVDLIVSDEVMAGERGHQLANHAALSGVPTLLMSGDNEIKEEMTPGAREFIGKPFRSAELGEQVRRILAKHKGEVSGD
jgi:two-component system OmpR family response regulator